MKIYKIERNGKQVCVDCLFSEQYVLFVASLLMRRQTSISSTPGIMISRTSRSGLVRPTSIKAEMPFDAVCTA